MDVLKIILLSSEVLWLIFYLNWWIIPLRMKDERDSARENVVKSIGLMRFVALVWYSPVIFPVKSLAIFVFIFFLTVKWIK